MGETWRCAGLILQVPDDWHGSADEHWYRVPDRLRDDPYLGAGSLVAVPPMDGYPDGNIGWVRHLADVTDAPAAGLPAVIRVIPPREWPQHEFRNGLFHYA